MNKPNAITDGEGRLWHVTINVLTLGRVRSDAEGMNLLEIIVPENALLDRLSTDPVELARVLFLLCRDELAQRSVTAESFYAALDRDCLDAALRAILEGVVNFSPSGLRPAYQKMLEKARTLEAKRAERMQSLVDSPDFERMLDSEIDKALSLPAGSPSGTIGDAGSWPASSASSPGETRLPRSRRSPAGRGPKRPGRRR